MLKFQLTSNLNEMKIVIKKRNLENLEGIISITHCKGHTTVLVGFDFDGFQIQHIRLCYAV